MFLNSIGPECNCEFSDTRIISFSTLLTHKKRGNDWTELIQVIKEMSFSVKIVILKDRDFRFFGTITPQL